MEKDYNQLPDEDKFRNAGYYQPIANWNINPTDQSLFFDELDNNPDERTEVYRALNRLLIEGLPALAGPGQIPQYGISYR